MANFRAEIDQLTSDSPNKPAFYGRPGVLLAVLLIASLLVRLPFRSDTIFHCDSFGYCMGGLGQYVSHSPGYFGYCTTGMALNTFIHDINTSFWLLSLTSTLVGIACCYGLARSFGLRPLPALAATAMYGLSINTLYFSTVVLSYAIEGLFATLSGWLLHRALRTRSPGWTAAGTLAWAVAGAFRQTTTAFMFPLWLFTLWRAKQGWWTLLHVALALPIIWSWNAANRYFLEAKSGFNQSASSQFWELQVMMETEYETAGMGVEENDRAKQPQYHWPFIEIAAAVLRPCSFDFPPHVGPAPYPEPSVSRALTLAGVQFLKLGFYLLFSLPALALLPLFVLFRRRLAWPAVEDCAFLMVWVVPVTAFFIVGHFGSLGYLQIYLAPLAVLLVGCLQTPTVVPDIPTPRKAPRFLTFLATALTLAGFVFYLFAQPMSHDSSLGKTLNVLVLQYSGPAIRQKYAVARSNINKPDPRIEPPMPPTAIPTNGYWTKHAATIGRPMLTIRPIRRVE